MSPCIYQFSTILRCFSSVYIIRMIFSNATQSSPGLPQHPVERRDNLMSCSCTDIFEIDRVNVWLRSGRGWEREMSENVRAEKRGLGKSRFGGLKSKDTEKCKSLTCQCRSRLQVSRFTCSVSDYDWWIKPRQCYQNWTSRNCKKSNSISQFLLRGV